MTIKQVLASAFVISTLAASAALAQPAPLREPLKPVAIDAPIVTSHVGRFNGLQVAYDAVVEPFITNDQAGKPVAKLVATSYIGKGRGDNRPVLFVFNGGPIVASTPLHMGVFGPKRLAVPDDITVDPATFKVVDNAYSPLDVADVVIFDPASTGYSRVLPGVAPESQFGIEADARQLAQLVGLWLKAHQRQGAPVYLVGESWGTIRAVEAAAQLQKTDTPADGIMLLGQAVNIIEYSQRPNNIISYAVSLPTLAALGWYHDKVDRKGKTFDQHLKEAQDYAKDEYLSVLFLGDTAPLARRQAVAEKLQALTGLPAEAYMKADLKLTKLEYQKQLFPGYVLDTYDARYKIAVGAPSYSFGYGAAALAQFKGELKVPEAAGVYSQLMPNAAFPWDFGPNKTPFGDWPYARQVRDVMTANPKFRVFVGNGYYDTQTTIGAMDYLVAQNRWPRDRVRTRYFEGGHTMYSVEASAKTLGDDVRAMLTHAW